MTIHLEPIIEKTGDSIERKIQTQDTTISVKINQRDPYIEDKIIQFCLLKYFPIKIDILNEYLQSYIKGRGFQIKDSYIEYFDLKSKKLLSQNKPEKWYTIAVIKTDTVPIDIIKSVGVKAYVATSPGPILKKMAFQIGLSLVLILIAAYCFIFLLRTIFRQRKIDKLRQDFVNSMVHEFKRPITTATTMMELLPMFLDKNDRPKVDEYIAGSMTEFKKLTAYTDRIQRISNNDKDRIQFERVEVKLKPFIEGLRTKYSVNNHKKVNVEVKIDTDRETIFVDELHFSNVMDNLFENAIKYSGDEVNIIVSVKENARKLEIALTDNGFGISDFDKKYIFDKFYRVDSKGNKKTTGFGLGLTYVKTIVEAHGGQIIVKDAPVKGSLFIITLPE
jgi:two-component system phosphate regulon sensor histidine kinase PhoR